MKKFTKRLLLVLTLVLSITFIGSIESSQAITYDTLPTGKNYIDSANVSSTFSSISIINEITVKPNTDYVISFPFDSPVDFFEVENFTVLIIVEGAHGFPIDENLDGGSYLEICSIDVVGYLSCSFNSGSATSYDNISLYTNGDSSMAWNDSTLMQLEEGTVGTVYEAYEEQVADGIAPIINGGVALLLTNVNDPISTATILSGLSATDETDGVVAVVVQTDLYTGFASTLGDYGITFRATDLAGNFTDLVITVRVVDVENPIITLIGSSTIYVEYGSSYSEQGSTVSDNYSSGLTATITGTVNDLILGSYPLNYNVSDSTGNSADQVTRTVIVQDTTAPVQTLSGDSTIYIEFGGNYTESGATWTDTFDISGSSVSSGSVNVAVLGSYTITYDITDTNGNVATTLTRTVIVQDTTGPVFTGSSSYTWNISLGYNLFYLQSLITANDLYSGDLTDSITVQSDNFTGSELTLGTYTVVLRATDSTGNYTDLTITINITDDLPPIFSSTLNLITLEYANTMTQQDIIDYFNN